MTLCSLELDLLLKIAESLPATFPKVVILLPGCWFLLEGRQLVRVLGAQTRG